MPRGTRLGLGMMVTALRVKFPAGWMIRTRSSIVTHGKSCECFSATASLMETLIMFHTVSMRMVNAGGEISCQEISVGSKRYVQLCLPYCPHLTSW